MARCLRSQAMAGFCDDDFLLLEAKCGGVLLSLGALLRAGTTVSGGNTGIYARNVGTGATTITAAA